MTHETVRKHEPIRHKYETRRRLLKVARIVDITPRMRRICFASPELRDFASLGTDDHVRLFAPAPNGDPDGVAARDYTPRAHDVETGELTVDFALHDAGPATRWAVSAKVGDELTIGGPRGSSIPPDDFDYYLLIGDETALPAIGRRVESLRAHVPVATVVVVDGPPEIQIFGTEAQWTPIWTFRRPGISDSDLLKEAVDTWRAPKGDGYVWIAAEAQTARDLRSHMVERRGHPKEWLEAAGYWVRGAAGATDKLHD